MSKNMKYGKEHWLNVVANLRKGELLREATCGQDQFLRSPSVISPVAKDGYKKFFTVELPHYQNKDLPFWFDNGPLWDGVMVDEATRKVLLFTAFCEPSEIEKTCPVTDEKELEALRQKIKKYYGMENYEPWLNEYYGIAEKLLLLGELNNMEQKCFSSGWRCEIFIFNFTDENGIMAVTEKQWEDYYDKAWNKLFPVAEEPNIGLFFNTVFPL